jgi:hypothetical protein
MALQLGRPRMINAGDCTVKTPTDCDMPTHPSHTLFAIPAPDEAPSSYTTQLVKYRLGQLIDRLMSLGALKSGFADHVVVQNAHAEILRMLEALPAHVRPEKPDTIFDHQYPGLVSDRLHVSILANSFLLALHRPHAAQHQQSLELAMASACRVLDDTQALFIRCKPHHFKIYTLAFYTIDAGLLLAAMLSRFPMLDPATKAHATASLRQAAERLAKLSTRNVAAIAGEKALRQCLAGLGLGVPATLEQAAVDNDGQQFEKAVPHVAKTKDTPGVEPAPTQPTMVANAPMSQEDQPMFDFGESQLPDLFLQLTDEDAWTSSWLESQMNTISSIDIDFDEDGLGWT